MRDDTMLLNLDKSNSTPLYIQIYQELKEKILSGELLVNEKLPSKRRMAEDNNISQNTVMNSYAQLLTEGFIISEERRGYFIANIKYQYKFNHLKNEDDEAKIERENTQKNEYRQVKYDLTQSTPDKNLFPFSVFSKLLRSLFQNSGEKLLAEGSGQGIESLRQSIQHYLSNSRGVPCSKEQIIVGPSSEFLLSILIQLIEEDIVFGIEDPGYQGFSPLMNRLNIPVESIPVDKEGVQIEKLVKSRINLLSVTSNHQFPTGSVMPLRRRQELLSWASEKKNTYIIENDYDSEFKYSGIPVPSLKYLDENNKVVHLGSFTRVLSPSIRMSYLVLPKKLLEIYHKKFAFHSSSISSVMQWGINDFIEKGHFETHLNRSKTFYKNKRDQVISKIHQMDSRAEIYGNRAGLHLLIKPSFSFDGYSFKKKAKAKGIKVNLLSDYSKQKNKDFENTLFFSFSSIEKEEISEVVEQIFSLLKGSSQ